MPHSQSPQERRRHPRLDGNIPLKICCGDFDIVTETQNLSRTGAYCRVNKFVEPMTRLKICLLLPFKREKRVVTKKVNCSGIVVRTESIPGKDYFNTAIFFSDIQAKDADTVSEFVEGMLTTHSFSSPKPKNSEER